jgi:hypothetical protein
MASIKSLDTGISPSYPASTCFITAASPVCLQPDILPFVVTALATPQVLYAILLKGAVPQTL